ncbi:DNA-formamidopyrimidine glycosylase [Candidatus Daviesbacteria bacterium RIFCSPLOWO2_01_FULL_39_12]|uniref:DNA-formamidopyrimidine glycosylase n=1 Tax=Candidatus Daviesbacteria bacterium RIFCSPLOWO2_01_FULL_39_12 TaxID=1797785 RepID=A0A1F5KQE6_9BACT|nr:MAG: DNA-formamidopyrimidine glycosylase [Candidatus Daviesbacteria bacterium RIFCSPHIGHO2_02_FULL_39_8]OGE43167.1 MAG: DNA-formamidopyrimidine glycosylase [Candidatus Daviesbacteria bacterium RIFCSPLOWO2_01_FULL_39_12]
MPELPEVETIKLGLQKKILGLRITKVQVNSPKSFIGNPNQVEGKKVVDIWRKAKMLGVELSEDQTILLFHLKMSGQLIYEDGGRFIGGHPTEDMLGKMPNSHTRVIFSFSDGSHLYFNDQRKFGWIRVSNKAQVTSNKLFEKLGPEPLEKSFTWQILKQNLLKHKSMPIKVAIMDQSVVSGVGNIYSNEACFDAKLDPRTKVGDLGDGEFKAIHKGVIKVIKNGIKHGGSTRAHFVDPEGHKGYFLDYAKVYWRDKHPCKVCKTEIKKITLGGRGTYFCPRCQS